MENKNDEMLDFVTVTAYYGLRRSEVLGLYLGKDSVDLENRRLHITRTVVKMKNLHDEDDTKTYDSYREFPITDEMYEFFQNVVKKKEEARKFYGNTYYESKSLFTWEDGSPFEPDYLVNHFDKLVKEYSEDPGQGDDGYTFTKGEMVKPFENAAFALKKNSYTLSPIKTDYGYHIIYRYPIKSEWIKENSAKLSESAAVAAFNKALETLIESAKISYTQNYEKYISTIK